MIVFGMNVLYFSLLKNTTGMNYLSTGPSNNIIWRVKYVACPSL
jgi:hypothetical protein